MDRLTQMELFVHTVELGSITRAAEALGLSDPVASRCLSALEQRLGARLLERTTRRQWLTEAGRAYHQRCVELLGGIAEADAAVNEFSARPSGLLRVTSSPSFAMMHIAPALPQFRRLYPNLSVQVLAANHYGDAIDAGVDVAIRTREHEPDSSITLRKLAEARLVAAASPAYLEAEGAPSTPQDLERHPWLIYGLSREAVLFPFSRDGRTTTLEVRPALQSTEGRVLCAAALAGGGILVQPMYTIFDDIEGGRLVPLLTEWELPRVTINLAYTTRKHQPAKIRAFNDFITAHFERQQYDRKWTQPFVPPAVESHANRPRHQPSARNRRATAE